MKILAVERMRGNWPSVAESALVSADVASPFCLPVTMMTDSAAVRRGMPMFVPDFASAGWELEAVPFFSVGRLGKSIAPRFAGRYLDGCGVALRAVPEGDMPAVPAGYVAGALSVNFDGAVAMGEKFAMDSPWLGVDFEIEAEGYGRELVTRDEMHIEETIALISRYMMFKTGDIVLPCRTGLRLPLTPDTRVECRVNGHQAISLKLK